MQTLRFELHLCADAAGYIPPGDKYAGLPTISLLIASDLVSSNPELLLEKDALQALLMPERPLT